MWQHELMAHCSVPAAFHAVSEHLLLVAEQEASHPQNFLPLPFLDGRESFFETTMKDENPLNVPALSWASPSEYHDLFCPF